MYYGTLELWQLLEDQQDYESKPCLSDRSKFALADNTPRRSLRLQEKRDKLVEKTKEVYSLKYISFTLAYT